MAPFDFIILFFSFIYTLALTHILFAATRMIRHRRVLVFSWEHALWMLSALLLLLGNWISMWDMHALDTIPLSMITGGFVFVVLLYVTSALVAPDFDEEKSYDMRAFHQREGRTYICAFAVTVLLSFLENFGAGTAGVENWGAETALVMAKIPSVILPLLFRARGLQLAAPAVLVSLQVVFLVTYYPALSLG
jgi:hypothetical protein